MSDNQELEKYLNNASFVRWILKRAGNEESEEWDRWVKLHPDREEVVSEARLIISEVIGDRPDYPDPDKELERLHHAIEQYEYENRYRGFKKYHQKIKPAYIAVAASVVILVGLAVILQLNTGKSSKPSVSDNIVTVQKFQTGYGQKNILRLSDGSVIYLNANSTLRFLSDSSEIGSVDFWLDGEAYFSIKHLSDRGKRIFRVHTKDGTIIDSGTKFSVSTRFDSTSVALVEGIVRIAAKGQNHTNNQKGYQLRPNEVAFLKRGGKTINVRHISMDFYTSWITNKLTYNHTSLRRIVRRIEDTYGVKVIVNDPEVLNETMSGSLQNDDLDILIRALSNALNLPISKQDRKIYIGQQAR